MIPHFYFVMILTVCRYVLKNKDTGDVLFVVVFSLLKKETLQAEELEKGKGVFNSSADDVD